MKTTKNPARYRKLSEPFESFSKANEALDEFYEGVEALREKCKLPDIHIIVRVNATTEGGEEADAFSTAHSGDSMLAESMVAYALGRLQRQRQEAIGELLNTGLKQQRNR
jgi:hypothetical protein